MASGRLSYAKARALTRVATAANEARLVEIALAATGAQLERLCRRFRRVIDEGSIPGMGAAVDPSCDPLGIRVRNTDAGHVRIEVTLAPVDAALVLAAIDRARDELRAVTGSTERVSAETRSREPAPAVPPPIVASRLDGLIAIAERTMAPAPQPEAAEAGNGLVPEVVIHLDQAALGADGAREAFLDDGTRVSAETFRFPMCSNVHAHHVEHWVHGGSTSLDNLVLLCSFHHRLLHQGGFEISVAANGATRFFTAGDREIAFVPDAPPAPSAPPTAVVDPDINLCGWDGEPVDYHATLDAMCVASVAQY